jgi:hypothetical protein
MAYFDEDKVFDALAIRNTSVQTSTESKSGEYKAKTIFIENSLNQIVSLQLQGARDGVWLNVGASTEIEASTNAYVTVSDYFPKYRMQATCATAPASGTLNVWVIKAGAA